MVGTLSSKLPFLIYVHNLQDGWRIATNFELRFVPITCRLVRPSAGTGNWWQTHRHWWCVGWWWSLTERECNESFWRIENGVKSASWTWCHGLGFSYSLFFLAGLSHKFLTSRLAPWMRENVHLTIGDSDSVTLLYSDILRKKLFLCCPKAKRALTKETLQKAGKGKAIVAILARCITAFGSPSWTPWRMPDIWQLLKSMILVPHMSWSFMQPVRESTTL